MKNIKIIAAVLLLMMFIGLPKVTFAAELPTDPPPDASINSESIVVNTITSAESMLIKVWTCGISDNHNGTVTIMASTSAYSIVNYLEAKVYLQRWNGSQWVDITSRIYKKSSSSSVSGSSIISVTSGYYRTRCVHTANNSGTSETQSSVSNAILIK